MIWVTPTNEDRIRPAQQLGVVRLDLSQDAHTQARSGEWMAKYHLVWKAQGEPQLDEILSERSEALVTEITELTEET